jgi:SNF2 family DNA or RNA helicase
MKLFARPSDKVIQGYRDSLQVIASEIFLPLRWENLRANRWKVDKYLTERSIRLHQIDRSNLKLSTQSTQQDLSVICLRKHVDLLALQSIAHVEDLKLPPVSVRQDVQLPIRDARMLADEWLVNLQVTVRHVDLISSTDLQLRSVGLDGFILVMKRFSFSPLRDDVTTRLFRTRGGPSHNENRIGAITSHEPPPSLRTADLQEKLRWLLTPPIHEVLSDPELALPEKPFDYQVCGIKWLYDRASCLLADEMGLGKTMQAIVAARLLWRDGLIKRILIVCPKTLIQNWRKELRHWWPGIDCYTLVAGSDRQRVLRLATNEVAVKIINYEGLRRELDWLKHKPPHHDLIIIDEAQRIKNPESGQSQAVKTLIADRRWALTGTPLENSIDDLISILDWVQPNLIKKGEMTAQIRNSVKPYILRRRQEEVLPELPEKIEHDIEVELGERQRRAYDLAERQGIVELNEKGDTITVYHVLTLITKLRQICNFDQGSGESAKADLLLEELEAIVENQRKALVFSQFIDERFGLKKLAKVLSESKACDKQIRVLQLHGEISQGQREGMIEFFETDPNYQVLLLNYSVGAVGLNLQAANYVFLFDRWWNPAVEDQAIKRCHRIGQQRKVFAMRFYCSGTIEERILTILSNKRRLFSDIIDENRPAVSLGLSEEEIFSLFKGLTVRPRRSAQANTPTRVVLDNLDHKRFEVLVALIYERSGYNVKVTGGSHDGGIDIVAERVNAGGRDRIVVQCKHQKQNVGRPVLQQLWGVVHADPTVTRCDLVTSAGFSREAWDFAVGKRLTLIDRGKLEELAVKYGVAQFVNL